MVLDGDKASLGRVAQAEPEKIGRLRQKALDLGISVDELILDMANRVSNEAEPIKTNADLAELKQSMKEMQQALILLAKEKKETAATIQTPQPLPNPFGVIGDFARAMGELQGYNNRLIESHEATKKAAKAEIMESLPETPDIVDDVLNEEKSPEDKALVFILDKFMSAQKGNNAPAAVVSAVSTPSNPAVTSKQPPEIIKKVEGENLETEKTMNNDKNLETGMSESELDGWIASIPGNVKRGVRMGLITFDMARDGVKEELSKRGVPAPSDADILRAYNKIKGGA